MGIDKFKEFNEGQSNILRMCADHIDFIEDVFVRVEDIGCKVDLESGVFKAPNTLFSTHLDRNTTNLGFRITISTPFSCKKVSEDGVADMYSYDFKKKISQKDYLTFEEKFFSCIRQLCNDGLLLVYIKQTDSKRIVYVKRDIKQGPSAEKIVS